MSLSLTISRNVCFTVHCTQSDRAWLAMLRSVIIELAVAIEGSVLARQEVRVAPNTRVPSFAAETTTEHAATIIVANNVDWFGRRKVAAVLQEIPTNVSVMNRPQLTRSKKKQCESDAKDHGSQNTRRRQRTKQLNRNLHVRDKLNNRRSVRTSELEPTKTRTDVEVLVCCACHSESVS